MSGKQNIVRFLAVLLALFLSGTQSAFFDCNKMPVLSFVGGLLTLAVLYGMGVRLYDVATSIRPGGEKLTASAGIVILGLVLLAGAGFFTLLTHLCP